MRGFSTFVRNDHFITNEFPKGIVLHAGWRSLVRFPAFIESLETYTKADFLTNLQRKHLYCTVPQPFKCSKRSKRHSREVRGFATKILLR